MNGRTSLTDATDTAPAVGLSQGAAARRGHAGVHAAADPPPAIDSALSHCGHRPVSAQPSKGRTQLIAEHRRLSAVVDVASLLGRETAAVRWTVYELRDLETELDARGVRVPRRWFTPDT